MIIRRSPCKPKNNKKIQSKEEKKNTRFKHQSDLFVRERESRAGQPAGRDSLKINRTVALISYFPFPSLIKSFNYFEGEARANDELQFSKFNLNPNFATFDFCVCSSQPRRHRPCQAQATNGR